MTRVLTAHLAAAAATLLLFPGLALAQDHAHPCLDEACATLALFDLPAGTGGQGAVPATPPRFGTWGIDLTGMDRTVKPGHDFFGFVNGAWARRTTIPSDRSSYGVSAVLREVAEQQVHTMIEEWAAATLSPASDEAKVAALYRSLMDEAKAEALDAAPLAPKLAAIRAATTREALAATMGNAARGAGGSFFGANVYGDQRDPDRYALYMGQSGLGLADREFYLRENFAKQKAE